MSQTLILDSGGIGGTGTAAGPWVFIAFRWTSRGFLEGLLGGGAGQLGGGAGLFLEGGAGGTVIDTAAQSTAFCAALCGGIDPKE